MASSKKHTQFKTWVQKTYPIYDQNGQINALHIQPKQLKNLILWDHTYLYSSHKGIFAGMEIPGGDYSRQAQDVGNLLLRLP